MYMCSKSAKFHNHFNLADSLWGTAKVNYNSTNVFIQKHVPNSALVKICSSFSYRILANNCLWETYVMKIKYVAHISVYASDRTEFL